MLLDKIKARIRVRTPWEAADLGTVLVGAFWKPIYLATFWVMLPFVITALLLFDDWYALLFIWFFKPLYDRIPLYILSHAIIGNTPTVRESLLFKNIFDRSLVSSLLHYRLNPLLIYKRSFTLPVFILEGLRGYQRSARIKILSRFGTHGLSLSALYLNIESVLYTSIILLIFVLLNPHFPHLGTGDNLVAFVTSLEQFFQHDIIITVSLYAFAVLIVEPLFVAAGFTQYLNRRTQMEGWDIELGFRLLSQTQGLHNNAAAPTDSTKRSAASRGASAAILLALTTLLIPPPVEASPAYTDPPKSRKIISEVATDERLHTGTRVTSWKKRDGKSSRNQDANWGRSGANEPLAFGLKFVLIAALVGVFIYFIYYSIRHWRPATRDRNSPSDAPPATLFGLEVDPESLPKNVISEVKRLWSTQQFRDAVSLLYRATLSRLVNQEGIQFSDSDTEGDCVQRVKQQVAPPKTEYFDLLVSAWQALAYAQRPPSAPQFDYLCQHWTALFDVSKSQDAMHVQ